MLGRGGGVMGSTAGISQELQLPSSAWGELGDGVESRVLACLQLSLFSAKHHSGTAVLSDATAFYTGSARVLLPSLQQWIYWSTMGCVGG